ncbi:MAG: putative intracellular protease/amidase [Bacteroidota bacterium]|nr:putative intracellular protease/amidase [Bacteroidota bacterium]
MKKALIPIPDKDFDTTEVALTWKIFKENGIDVSFATENGAVGETDPLLLTGVIFGQLGADKEAKNAYAELQNAQEFLHPVKYNDINPKEYDLLFLPGGHAKGMRQYLESKILQQKVVEFFHLNKWVGSVCHGPLVLARSIDPETGRSIVYNYYLTALPRSLEKLAYNLTKWKLGDYYRTYSVYVQDEIGNYLAYRSQFKTGFSNFVPFIVEDRNLITARWPKDVRKLAETLVQRLNF